MKIIALDVGLKRIGVAVADTTVKIAVPHSVVEVDGTELEHIANILKVERANHLVAGLPRNAQGEETAQSAAVRAFVGSLQDYFKRHKMKRPLVKYQDESLTSMQAEANLALNKRKKNRAKGEVDREAATLILQDFLDSFGMSDGAKLSGRGGVAVKKGGATSDGVAGEAMGAMQEDLGDSKKKSKRKGRGFKIFATIVALLIVAVVGAVVWYGESLKAVHPENCRRDGACERQEFVILEGESVGEVTEKLINRGLIRSNLVFRVYLKLEQKEKVIKAGAYMLDSGMTVAEIVGVLEGGAAQAFKMEILPGDTVEAVKQRLVRAGYEFGVVDAAFEKKYVGYGGDEGDVAAKSYLYADTYSVGVGAKVEDFVEMMLARLAVVSEENNLKVQFAGAGLTFRQGFELAARVRTEVGGVSERAVSEMAKAAELIKADDKRGVSGVAVDRNALVGVAYSESKVPYVASGDYKGWKEVYGAQAKAVGEANGIPYEAILAQSILESSWGKSKLAYKYFNFFGIKYANMPQNPAVAPTGSVNMTTWEEYEPGVSTTISADFAAWDSVEKGFRAYAAWIRAQSRYAGALQYPDDPVMYITALKEGGYATDNNYVSTLSSIISSLREN